MNVLIVDDERVGRVVLRKLVEFQQSVNEIYEADSVNDAKKILEIETIDVVFLDIHMPGQSGLELAKSLDRDMYNIVFVTAHDEYAIEAFDLNAVHYICKPVSSHSIKDVFKRLEGETSVKDLKEKRPLSINKLVISDGSSFDFYPLDSLYSIRADGAYSYLKFGDIGLKTTSKPIGYYEELLQTNNFIRCHHSHIVNLNKIISFSVKKSMIELSDGQLIPVSKRKKNEVISAIESLTLK